MTFTENYRDLFAYDRWANERVCESIAGADEAGELLRLFAHTLGAQNVWLSRIVQPENPSVLTWPELTIEECRQMIEECHAGWNSLFGTLFDSRLDDAIVYRNTQGAEFTTSLRDILTHVVNHSTYHRAQVARGIRQLGGTPPVTDFIVYVREVRP